MITYTEAIESIDDIRVLIDEKCIIDDAQLLIQFFCASPDPEYIQKFQNFFKLEFPLAVLVGATTDGVINDGSVYAEVKSVVTFSIFEKTRLKCAVVEHKDTHFDSFESGKSLASSLYEDDTKVIISFSDGIYTNGEEFLLGLSSINKKVFISGGMAGDNGLLKRTYIFDKEKIILSGAIGVVLNSKDLEVNTDYNFNWTPIGKKMHITKAVKNRVYEIDGVNAVELYKKYLGSEIINQLERVAIQFPLLIQRDNVVVGRVVLIKHEDNSLSFSGTINEGEYVQFGLGDVDRILGGSDYHLRRLLDKTQFQPESFFIYSCMARRRFVGNSIEKELMSFAKIAPTAGFFTYGEFFHSEDTHQLFNETMTVLALSEKNAILDQYQFQSNPAINDSIHVSPIYVISHLANVVTKELENLNNTLEERIEKNRDLVYKQAYYDTLTGLPNRLKLIEELPYNIEKTLLLINIDDFTLINDFYGHIVGDIVLNKLAKLLDAIAVEIDAKVYKLPSDEYVLILHKNYIEEELIFTIRKILSVVREADIIYEAYLIKIAMTISSATINKEGTGLVNADMALKLAKKSGLNYMIFEESLMLVNHYKSSLEIAQELRRAIKENCIVPYFQAIYDLKTNKIDKYECLVRLKKEDGSVLSPYLFLGISQKIKLYSKITKIMVEKTFTYFKANRYNFSINLSFEDILNEQTKEFIFKSIQEYGIAKQLTIEILETQQIEKEPVVKEFIERVYELGAKIAIDDFGSGFANFEHMTKIKSDYIKIDGSLIKNIDVDENARLVVETIIVFAQKLNMKTVAEFVHSKAVYDIVKELNIDFVQGYHLSEPLKDC